MTKLIKTTHKTLDGLLFSFNEKTFIKNGKTNNAVRTKKYAIYSFVAYSNISTVPTQKSNETPPAKTAFL